MEIMETILSIAQLGLLIVLSILIIKKKTPEKPVIIEKVVEKPAEKTQEVDEKEKKKQENVKKAFNNLMQYDYDTALNIKKIEEE